MKYYAKKLAFYAIALWAAVTLNFFIPRLLPGNPVDIMLAKLAQKGPVSPAARQSLELLLGTGTDVPVWEAYLGYLRNVVTFDFGPSITYYPTPVVDVISQALPWTIVLVGVSTVLSFVLGITLGTIAGWRRGGWLDNLIPITTMLQAVPYFWMAIILVYLLAVIWPIFPAFGGYDIYSTMPGWSADFVGSAVYYAFLPALTIVISSVGGWMLGMRNMMSRRCRRTTSPPPRRRASLRCACGSGMPRETPSSRPSPASPSRSASSSRARSSPSRSSRIRASDTPFCSP